MIRLLVLGLLDERPMSGYDIQRTLKLMEAEHWGNVLPGSIYHALKKLEAEKHIQLAAVEYTGLRQKAVYNITQQGREHLKALALDALGATTIGYPGELYGGVTFIDKLPPEMSWQALETRRLSLAEESFRLEVGLREKRAAAGGALSPMLELVFEHMFAVIRQQQEFVERAQDLLKQM